MIVDTIERISEFHQKGWWSSETITDYLNSNLAENPDRLCVADAPNRAAFTDGEPMRLTWTELKQKVDNLAGSLVEIGIKKDDVIMMQLPNIVEAVVTYLAIARIGAIISPLAPQFRTSELRSTMSMTEPKAYITTNNFNNFNFVDMVLSVKAEIPTLETIISLGDNLPEGILSLTALMEKPFDAKLLQEYGANTKVTGDDIFTICWTSGTESDPKGVPRSYNHWKAIAWVLTETSDIYKGNRLLLGFPLINMASIAGNFYPWLTENGCLFLHQPFDLKVFFQQVREEKINNVTLPPPLLNTLLNNEALLAQLDLSSVKSIRTGAAPVTPFMFKGFQDKGIYVIQSFGSNEGVALMSTTKDFIDPEIRAMYWPRWGVDGIEASFECAQQVQSKIIDEYGQEIKETGVTGELCFKGATIFAGYYKRPDLTEKAFDKDGYFKTGDAFSIEGENGEFYKYQGRLKDIIVRGGFNISAQELENIIIEHPRVAEVAIVGYPDEVMGEKICAVVVPAQGETIGLEEVLDTVKDLAKFKWPEKLMVVDTLPRNNLGKVLKRDLRKLVK